MAEEENLGAPSGIRRGRLRARDDPAGRNQDATENGDNSGRGAFHGSDFAATTVLSASPRRDWNGRLRTTSCTSVWNP